VEEYVAWRLQLHESPTAPIETALADGRWLRITARRTARGGTVAIHTEITQLKERETALRDVSKQLSEQNLLFNAALNNMIQGLCMFGADQRLIVVNRRYLEMYGFSADVVKPGITLREIRNTASPSATTPPKKASAFLPSVPPKPQDESRMCRCNACATAGSSR
jgi:PAS domain-containing protein